LIRTRNLTKKFAEKIAVNNLNLQIDAGEIYGFLGPNGAGKTTTIKMLTGILYPTSGEISIMGKNIRKHELEIKRAIGVVPDEPRMYHDLRGKEFVSFIMDIYDVDREEAKKRFDEICDVFDIDYLDEFIGEYSHGMSQKLMVATVLMRKPKVLFLDEPTVGLDARSARVLKMLLRKYADEGSTIFMTTHILEIAEKMCERIGIINEGDLIAEGTLDELRASGGKGEHLEDIFLSLTGANDEEMKEIVEGL